MQAFWPTAEGELANRLNELPRRLLDAHGPGLERDRPGPGLAGGSARLRKELDSEILVYGSRRLSRALIGMGLVDELPLLVYLVVLGTGGRLFGETQDKFAWIRRRAGGRANAGRAPTGAV